MSTQEKAKSLTTHGPERSSPEQLGSWSPPSPPRAGPTVAEVLRPLVHVILGIRPPVRIEFWDDSVLGPDGGPGSVLVRSPDALRNVLWAPGELGLARAFIAGDLDFRGDIIAVLRALRDGAPGHRSLRVPLVRAFGAAQRVGAVGLPLARPVEEVSPRGLRHSRQRDAHAIRHHYDISNDFYQLVLGPTMTYSCAYFTEDSGSLDSAQVAKHDLVCRKLGLDQSTGMRLLDLGCGWGAMAIHAARAYGADVVGVTLSEAQAQLAQQRVRLAGLESSIEIRVQDYRDLADERFDAVSSVGMFEHVGRSKMATYFESLHDLLAPTGRLLNHAISSIGGSRLGGRSFIGRYVFPDGELLDVGDVVLAMEESGFEVRDVESLREHYVRTLRSWVGNLQANWEQAVGLVGVRRARIWLLYMAASANGFDDGGISIHQVLGVRPGEHGESGMPATRVSWSRGAM